MCQFGHGSVWNCHRAPAMTVRLFKTRIFNDQPASTVTTTNSYPSSITIKDEWVDSGGGQICNNFRLSADGGATPADFANGDAFSFAADVTLTGTASAETGLLVSPWWSPDVDGRFMINGASGEIACFGGRLPFYSFTANYSLTYTLGDTVRMEVSMPLILLARQPGYHKYLITMARQLTTALVTVRPGQSRRGSRRVGMLTPLRSAAISAAGVGLECVGTGIVREYGLF